MATYYVSIQNGNDGNSGTAVDQAKATFQAGVNLATNAGDVVYIGPGTYRERVVGVYSGIAGNYISFIGDPDAVVLTADHPAPVRLTSSNPGDTWHDGTSNGTPILDVYHEDYTYLKNLWLDGTCGTAAHIRTTYGIFSNDTCFIENCFVTGASMGIRAGFIQDCLIFSPNYATRTASAVNSVIFAGYAGSYQAGNASFSGCIINGTYYGLYATEGNQLSTHNLYCGGFYANRSVTSVNDIYFAGYYGPYLSSVSGALFDNNNILGRGNLSVSASYCGATYNDDFEGTGLPPNGMSWSSVWYPNPDKFKYHIKKAFEPWLMSGLKSATGVSGYSSAGDKDVLGRDLYQYKYIPIGPYAVNTISEEFDSTYYNTTPPGIFIIDKGTKSFDVIAATGDITITAWAKTFGSPFTQDVGLRLSSPQGYFETSTDYSKYTYWHLVSVSASITGCSQRCLLEVLVTADGISGAVSDIGVF
jgi:hypothetical protein